MKLLVLGGTAWLGREVVRAALLAGHEVACLARGSSGQWPAGVRVLSADRDEADAYQAAAGEVWDAVIDLARQPGHVRGAVRALGESVAHWVYVSSISVYARHDEADADESGECVEPLAANHMSGPADYAGAKRAGELALCEALPAHRVWIVRPGLIAGPGDETDRTGYWPQRFARALDDGQAVLMPDAPELRVQIVDVRDLAQWLVRGAALGQHGVHHAVGAQHGLDEHLAWAQAVANWPAGGPTRRVPSDRLLALGVQPWAGPRSMPLWVPGAQSAGLGARSDRAALAAGLRRRPVRETLADTLVWERSRPPAERRAGLSPVDEAELLQQLDSSNE